MIKVVVDLPLLNLLLPRKWDQKMLLSDSEHIRKAKPDEFKLQKGHIGFFVLEIIRNGEDLTEIGNDIIDWSSYFMKVLTLFKVGRIGYGSPVYVEPKLQTFDDYKKYHELTVIDEVSIRSIGIWSPNYSLLENEIEPLLGFNDKMMSLQFDESNSLGYSIDVSLERLVRTQKSMELYEKLLDCMMSLEAIFLTSEGELSYRLSHRIANICGESETERRYVADFLKRCYNERSKILHGAQFDVDEWGYIYGIEDLEEIARKCVRRVIALSQLKYRGKGAKKRFLEDLDSCTFDSELRSDMQSYEKKYFEIDFPRTSLHLMKESEKNE